MTGKRLRFETEICWFVLVSVLDIVMTFLVLRYSADGLTTMTIVESNPVARWIISHWGLRGMVVFKMLLVSIVVVIAEVVGTTRPQIARLLLGGGTVVVAGVVIYSVRLMLQHRL